MDYTTLPSRDTIAKTAEALKARGITVHIVETKADALDTVKKLIPAGVEIMAGASVTLEEIGFIDLLKSGAHPWRNLRGEILVEKDPEKQQALRKESALSPYFIGSVHAIAETGETVVASNSGSQIAPYAYTSNHILWVAGAQKIVPTLDDGLRRVREHSLPLEDKRMKSVGYPGSAIGMILVFERKSMPHRTIDLILVNEALGF